MTVADLIEKLREFPQNMEVIQGAGYEGDDIKEGCCLMERQIYLYRLVEDGHEFLENYEPVGDHAELIREINALHVGY